MADLSSLRWAQVPQTDFSTLGDLAKTYREGLGQRALADLGKGIQNGTIDYTKAAGQLIAAGKPEIGLSLLTMGQQQKASDEFLRGLNTFGGGTSSVQPSASVPQRVSTADKVYSNDEPSPLDPPSGRDRDLAVRTILAEAGNQGPAGMQAVGNVIRNRAVAGSYGGDAPSGVVTAPNQFEPWNTAAGRTKMASIDPASPQYQAAASALDRAYTGDDPTRGATHFYAPKAQAALGRPAPSWDNGRGQDIGDHRFFGPAGSTDVSAQNRPQPQTQPQSSPSNPLSDPKVRWLIGAVASPNVPAGQKEVAKMMLAEEIKKNPEIAKLEVFKQRPDLFDLEKQLKQAGATAITNDMRGENAESVARGKAAGERAAETMKAAAAASKNLQNLSRMEGLLAQINQGKVEPSRMTVSAWAKSLGLDDATAVKLGLDPNGVGTAQAVGAMANELTLGKIGAGGMPANNFSDADRSFLVETGPRLANDPKGNALIIEAARRIAKIDMQKARDWNDYRSKNKSASFDDFEVAWNDKLAGQNIFADLQQQADAIVQQGAATRGQPQPTNPQPLTGGTSSGVKWRVVQ